MVGGVEALPPLCCLLMAWAMGGGFALQSEY